MYGTPPDPVEMQRCQHCGGDGTVPSDDDDSVDMICPECDGECIEPIPEDFGFE